MNILKTWRMAGYQLPKVSVNLSIKQFELGNVVHLVEKILAGTGLPPECLELEITESFIVKADEAFRFVADLRALGIHLSVDDFGTGYSSGSIWIPVSSLHYATSSSKRGRSKLLPRMREL